MGSDTAERWGEAKPAPAPPFPEEDDRSTNRITPQPSWVSRWRRIWERSIPYIFIAPAMLTYLYFFLWPSMQSLQLAFFEYDGFSPDRRFIGLENFSELLFHDDLFWVAIRNNVLWTLGSLALPMTLGLLLAVILNSERVRGRNTFRTAFFVPYTLSLIVVGMLWKNVYNPQAGLLNTLIGLVIGRPFHHPWLGDDRTALLATLLASTWAVLGFYLVIFSAGLQTIPKELYEAAEIEGAGFWQTFFYITIPLLREITTIMVIITIIGSFKVFDIIYTMTGGGPINATDVTATRMLVHAFKLNEFGYAAAYASIMFLIIFVFSTTFFLIQQRRAE